MSFITETLQSLTHFVRRILIRWTLRDTKVRVDAIVGLFSLS